MIYKKNRYNIKDSILIDEKNDTFWTRILCKHNASFSCFMLQALPIVIILALCIKEIVIF